MPDVKQSQFEISKVISLAVEQGED